MKNFKVLSLTFICFIFTLNTLSTVATEPNSSQATVSSAFIKGDLDVMRPIVGESMANYILVINNVDLTNESSVKFSLKENYKGVSISERGRLIVTPEAGSDKITISATFNHVMASLDITLFDSFTATAIDTDGTPLAIPTPNQMDKVIDHKNFLTNPKVINIIKISFVVITFSALIWYGFTYKKYKNTKE